MGPSSFFAGDYALLLFGQAAIQCEGSLEGREADFDLGLAAVGLMEGTLTLEIPSLDVVIVSGEPIESAFGIAAVTLRPGDVGMPLHWYAGLVERDLPGPDETRLDGTFLGLDIASSTPNGSVGRVGFVYHTSDLTGRCEVGYVAALASL